MASKLKKLFDFCLRRLIEIVIIVLVVTYLPGIPPRAEITKEYRLPASREFVLNNRLDGVEQWHKGSLIGPEAFADYNGELYTSISGGDVVKLTGSHISPVVKFGKPCEHLHEEKLCGRPLGLQFDKTGTLYVADSYYGIFKVNVNTGEKEQLVGMKNEIDGSKPRIPNSIALAKNGDFYWTDSSTQFDLEDGVFDMLADASGRLVHYNSKTKTNTVLMKNLHFANGVVLSDDESFVLVAETARNRIHRYYLNGPKKGSHDIFIDGLPGMPDNLKSDGQGGFLVPLVVAVDAEHPQIFQVFSEFPKTRRFFARFLGLIEFGFVMVNRVYKNSFCDQQIHNIGHFSVGTKMFGPPRTTILRLNREGEIIDTLHTTNKDLTGISESHIFKDHLYLGSPFNDYIGRIPLEKIGWQNLAVKKTPTTTTPKPTTTTPKPTTTTTTPKPTTTTTPRPTTTTPKPTTTTPKPTTTTTTTPKVTTTTSRPTTTEKPVQAQAKKVPSKKEL